MYRLCFIDAVVLLWRENVSALIAEASLAHELNNGQKEDGINAEGDQVVELSEHVQKLGRAIGAVRPVEGADMQLVDDKVAEIGGLIPILTPGIACRIYDHAFTAGVRGCLCQFTCVRIPLPADIGQFPVSPKLVP